MKIIILILLALLISGCSKKNWTLMICEDAHFSGGCNNIKYELYGYENQKDCMEKGILLKNPNGFECGNACRTEGSLKICAEICNEKGCN